MDQKSIREQTIRDAKSNLILDAARDVFSGKGFHETRLEDIAEKAGFSKASLYNYFSDKEQIFLSLAARDFEELLSKINHGMVRSGPLHDSMEYLFKTVFTFFGEHITFYWEVTNYQKAGASDLRKLQGHHDDLKCQFMTNYEGILTAFSDILRDARKRGEILSVIDERTLSQFVASLVQGAIFEWKVKGKIGHVDKTVKDLLEFIAHGLGSSKAPGPFKPNGR